MLFTAQLVAVSLLALAVGQAFLTLVFVWRLLQSAPSLLSDERCPKAAVVLSLRGADPSLRDCLTAIISQNYPNYELHIVVDSDTDPAWKVAHEAAQAAQRPVVQIRPLTNRRSTCSLKCSALLQAIGGLDDTFQIVALVDADTIAHRTWLRELATALDDPQVGAATGNRWYFPVTPNLGSLVRYLWNAAAIVQMYWYEIAWGGTLALRLDVARNCGWLNKIGLAFCEDTMLRALLAKQGLRVQFVPTLFMVNREACSLSGCYTWVARQLLTARLYHPHWPLVVGHAVSTTTGAAIGFVLLLAAAFTRQTDVAIWAAIGVAIYYFSMIALLGCLEAAARFRIAARGESTTWITTQTWLKFFPSIVATQLLYPAAMACALFLKIVTWRGITYEIVQPWQIRRTGDQPYLATDQAAEEFSL